MSHFSKIQTQIVDKDFLTQAIKDLGMNYEEGNLQILGFGGQKASVEIKIKLPFSHDIGFRKTGEFYEIVADWAVIRGVKKDEFVQKLSQRYAYHAARTKLEEQGFTLIEEQVADTGQIKLVLRRMA